MTTFKTSREFAATPAGVFAAFSHPDRLARWWGPAGFTNTFELCEFKAGGKWKFTMHGPDGSNYPNESVFAEIEADRKVVIDHVCRPFFRLTVELHASATGAQLTWAQAFAEPAVAEAVRLIVEPSNEQNLDRLAVEVAGGGV